MNTYQNQNTSDLGKFFRFEAFVTTPILMLAYAIITALTVVGALAAMIGTVVSDASPIGGITAWIGITVGAVIFLAVLRLIMEAYVILFAIHSELRKANA